MEVVEGVLPREEAAAARLLREEGAGETQRSPGQQLHPLVEPGHSTAGTLPRRLGSHHKQHTGQQCHNTVRTVPHNPWPKLGYSSPPQGTLMHRPRL